MIGVRAIPHRWLLLRRITQLSVMLLFLAGPWFGVWIIEGNLNASTLLGTVPLADPFMLTQILATGQIPEAAALQGAALVALAYALAGGRAYCSWVCPVNPVTDGAGWLRRRFHFRKGWSPSPTLRYWLLLAVVTIAAVTGLLAWEFVNPVSMTHRGLIFGIGLAWLILLAVFLFDLLVAPRGWCGHLCPMGAFYSLLGVLSPARIAATRRDACDDCAECYRVCPEPQVLKPALKGPSILIASSLCSNCGRCIDLCPRDVFQLVNRFALDPERSAVGRESSSTSQGASSNEQGGPSIRQEKPS